MTVEPLTHETGEFRASAAWALFSQRWTEPGATVPLVLLHGAGEHSGRHAGTAARLVAEGYDVHSFDWPGHGRSPGKRGHIGRFDEFVEITDAFVRHVTAQRGSPPLLLAHSLGGLIATVYAVEHGECVRAVALSSPVWGLALRVPFWKRAVAYGLVNLMPSLTLRRPAMGPNALSHDPEVEARYAADPLVHFESSLMLYVEVRRTIATLPTLLPRLRRPTLVMAGGDDHIASLPAVQALVPLIGSADKRLIVYPGYAHEILHEVGKDAVFADLLPWLRAHR